MRLVVTRPQPDGDRTAAVLRERGHDVLVAPLMRAEPVAADLGGTFAGIVVTSANAPRAIGDHPQFTALKSLPVFAVGKRSAEAAREAGFSDVASADGDAADLLRLIAAQRAAAALPLLYLAGQERAADIAGELARKGMTAKTVVVYRAVTLPFPDELSEALGTREVEAVLHFSARSAGNYLSGAKAAGLLTAALEPCHFCLSAQTAAPLAAAGAATISIAAQPDEAALIALVERAQG